MFKLTAFAVAIYSVFGGVLFGLDLPRIARANGYVDSSAVPIKIYSPIAATVTKIHWQNGQMISARAPLIFATTERPQGGTFVGVAAAAVCARATANVSPAYCASVGAAATNACNNLTGATAAADTSGMYAGGAIDDGARG